MRKDGREETSLWFCTFSTAITRRSRGEGEERAGWVRHGGGQGRRHIKPINKKRTRTTLELFTQYH